MSIREGKSVKRFERSNGLDTALYKNDLFFYLSKVLGPINYLGVYILLQNISYAVSHYDCCYLPVCCAPYPPGSPEADLSHLRSLPSFGTCYVVH